MISRNSKLWPVRRQLTMAALAVAAMGTAVGVFASTAGAANSAGPQLPAKKGALIAQQQHHLAKAQAHAAIKADVHGPALTAPAPQAPITGIIQARQAPFSSSSFAVSNEWTGDIDGTYYTVYAGAKTNPATDDPQDAGVILYTDPSNVNSGQPWHQVGVYPAGTGSAPLTIQKADGAVLTLSYGSGQDVTFDVTSRTFGG